MTFNLVGTRFSRVPERNYDVRNQELHVVKVALEERRHYLEGAQHPFFMWTDHQNLENIRAAQCLNALQARRDLFFNRFTFTLSENTKPDALSRLPDPISSPESPSYIFPCYCVVGAITWRVERVSGRPQLTSSFQVGVLLTVCLSQYLSTLRLSTGLTPPRSPAIVADHLCHQATLLVAVHREGSARVCSSLSCLHPQQDLLSSPFGPPAPLPVPHRPWSKHGLANREKQEDSQWAASCWAARAVTGSVKTEIKHIQHDCINVAEG